MPDYGSRGQRYPGLINVNPLTTESNNYVGGIEMAKWIIAGSVLGGVILYPQYINYVGGIEMTRWIIAGSVLLVGALLGVSLWAPAPNRPTSRETEPENAARPGRQG